eukprot:3434700-Heterocapsa_arctica.AAC.1
MLFVTLGLFNIIAALFVENTIENAKKDDDRRHEPRDDEYMRVARRLHGIVIKFFAQDGSGPIEVKINPWESVKGLLFSWGAAHEE